MKVDVKPRSEFRSILGEELHLRLEEGSNIEDLLRMLQSAQSKLFGPSGLRDEVNIMVNGRNIDSLQGLKTPLYDGDEVVIFSAAIGG
jgi:sulfur-carrier protein